MTARELSVSSTDGLVLQTVILQHTVPSHPHALLLVHQYRQRLFTSDILWMRSLQSLGWKHVVDDGHGAQSARDGIQLHCI